MVGPNLYESTWKCRDALTALMLHNLLPLQLLCFLLFDLISVICAAVHARSVLHPEATGGAQLCRSGSHRLKPLTIRWDSP